MRRMTAFAFLALLLLASGCATMQAQNQPPAYRSAAPAAREVNPGNLGHPFRILAGFLHPVGVVTDYLVFRPMNFIASKAPGIFGYTPEDAEAYARHVGSR